MSDDVLHNHQGAAARRAVIDIGSNSVRLVIYDGPARAPIAIFNEKSLCGLGRDLTPNGEMRAAAVDDAIEALHRYRALLTAFGEPRTHVIATAAVREAANGGPFVEAIKSAGFNVRVISGAEEAALAALGVVSFEPGATGLAGDMGGGSLELVALDNGGIAETASLPLGPFSVMRVSGADMNAAQRHINAEFEKLDFLNTPRDTLYSVGGAWRAVARIHMRLKSYPLSVLHHYELSSAQAIAICDLISKQSRRSLEEIPGIPRRRIDTLPYAALVLKSVLQRIGAKRVVVSSGGVREGLLFEDLSARAREDDPLMAGAQFFASRLAPMPGYGEAAWRAIEPLCAGESFRRWRATCLMMDIGAYFHPDMRARQAFDTALSAPLVGVTHEDRIWIALALFRRHEGRSMAIPNERAIGLLSWEDHQSATRLGLALRFLTAFAPKVPALLDGCQLSQEPGKLIFSAPKRLEKLMGETPLKRFAAAAEAFEAEQEIRFTG